MEGAMCLASSSWHDALQRVHQGVSAPHTHTRACTHTPSVTDTQAEQGSDVYFT